MTTNKTAFFLAVLALTILFAAQNAQAGQCRDPWVTQAIQQVKGRAPNASGEAGECNIKNFNNGHWNSYDELAGYVRNYFNNRPKITGTTLPAGTGFAKNTGSLPGGIVKNTGSLYGNNPNGMVAAGGGNMVAAGAGNMVAAGAGNMVAAGGGNLADRRNS